MLKTLREATYSDGTEIAALVNAAYHPSPQSGGGTQECDRVAGNRTECKQLISIFHKTTTLRPVAVCLRSCLPFRKEA